MRILLFLLLSHFLIIYPVVGQGYLMLTGGGSESNASGSWSQEPYSWFVEKADDKPIVVLSQNDTSTWLPNYFLSFGATEVHNLRISTDSPEFIAEKISEAGGVFLKGGNQQNYIDAWKGTQVETAIRTLFEEGGVVGGTSAGAMAISEFVSTGGPVSSENLRNPFNGSNRIEVDFLKLLPNAIVDTHYFERGRVGRLLGIMGRISVDYERDDLLGIGVDDQTSVLVYPSGNARVSGSGGVHFFRMNEETMMDARPNRSLHITNMHFNQLTHGFEVNLETGEIVNRPSNTIDIPFTSPTALPPDLHFSRNAWSTSRINALIQEDDDSVSWSVISDETYNTATILNRENVTEFIFSPSLLEDDESLDEIFSSQRVFISLNTNNFLALSESGRLQSAEAKLELPLELLQPTGEGYATNLTQNGFITYDGNIRTRSGAKLLPGVVLVDSTYQSSVFFENRASATGWLMNEFGASVGINVSGIRDLTLEEGVLTFGNMTVPAIVFDAREGFESARSPFSPSNSSSRNRNSAAITSGLVHVLPSGESFVLYDATGTSVGDEDYTDLPSSDFQLIHAYPNPFNPSTQIVVDVRTGFSATMQVFDIMGRRVLSTYNLRLTPGRNTIPLDLKHVSSGVYVVRISSGTEAQTMRVTLIK